MKHLLVFFTICLLFNCKDKVALEILDLGTYRATLKVNEVEDLPFNFEVISPTSLNIFNAEEIIEVDDINYKNDSVYINLPVYEGFIVAKIENQTLKGSFIKPSLNKISAFEAVKNDTRFNVLDSISKFNVAGNWETVFNPNSQEEKYKAKGIFNQNGNIVTGTFRTAIGDYRYLEGVLNGNQLKLSTFDGSHGFLFTAKVTDSRMVGTFYTVDYFEEPFIAERNDAFDLPDAYELTFLNEGYDKVEFAFPDINGNLVSLNDERFKNKVVLVQIMGTYCPNCLDESKYYSQYYKAHKNEDLEIIALAFEYVKTEIAAFKNITRLKNKIGIEYPILLAQYGSLSKIKAQEKLPMLNHVLSYPTTIFIDKLGVVRKIHTGFNGPATGDKYIEFKKEFERFVSELLNE